MNNANAVLTLAYRDFLKLVRDPVRMVSSVVFPVIFVGVLGGAMQANLGAGAGYNLLTFTFTGIFVQTMFQSTAQGIISLVEDRQADFSQEIFISPISRYAIIFGKILGETMVALPQGVVVLLFGLVIGVRYSFGQGVVLVVAALIAALLGGAFGVLVMANLDNQRGANQVFPFLILPQFFLAGVFAPIKQLPAYLEVFSRLTPMRYAIDLGRGLYYAGTPDYNKVVLADPLVNLAVMAAMFLAFMAVGTYLFVRRERTR